MGVFFLCTCNKFTICIIIKDEPNGNLVRGCVKPRIFGANITVCRNPTCVFHRNCDVTTKGFIQLLWLRPRGQFFPSDMSHCRQQYQPSERIYQLNPRP